MKQFGKILKFELKYYFKNKVFIGITIFLVLLIAAVMFFPRITAMFEENPAGDNGDIVINDNQTETDNLSVMLVKADDPAGADMVRETFAASFADYDVQITDADISVIKDKVTSGDAECAFVMTGPTSFTYYVDNLSMYDMNTEIATSALQQIYQMNAMINGGMSAEDAANVMSIQIESEVESLGKDQMQNFFTPTL